MRVSMAAMENLRFESLKSAPLDRWVALTEDTGVVVASGSSYDEAVNNSACAGVQDPVLVKTPKAWSPSCKF
jgi:hypothetical protein